MSTGRYTPGPWELTTYYFDAEDASIMKRIGRDIPIMLTNEGQRIIMSGTGDDRKRVAVVDAHMAYKRGRAHELQSDPERDANARLIAAAPELYGACENALSALIACCVPGGGVDDKRHILEAQQMLRAALAKVSP